MDRGTTYKWRLRLGNVQGANPTEFMTLRLVDYTTNRAVLEKSFPIHDLWDCSELQNIINVFQNRLEVLKSKMLAVALMIHSTENEEVIFPVTGIEDEEEDAPLSLAEEPPVVEEEPPVVEEEPVVLLQAQAPAVSEKDAIAEILDDLDLNIDLDPDLGSFDFDEELDLDDENEEDEDFDNDEEEDFVEDDFGDEDDFEDDESDADDEDEVDFDYSYSEWSADATETPIEPEIDSEVDSEVDSDVDLSKKAFVPMTWPVKPGARAYVKCQVLRTRWHYNWARYAPDGSKFKVFGWADGTHFLTVDGRSFDDADFPVDYEWREAYVAVTVSYEVEPSSSGEGRVLVTVPSLNVPSIVVPLSELNTPQLSN